MDNILNRVAVLLTGIVLLTIGCTYYPADNTEKSPATISPQDSSGASQTNTPSFSEKYWIAPEPIGCGNQSEISGKILFLKQGDGYELHVMNGFGCLHRLIMKNVFGAPSWSVDGKKIAIGCEGEKYLCILDANATFDTCLQTTVGASECEPIVLEKIKLPTNEPIHIYNTSWSYDGSEIAINGEYASSHKKFTSLISLYNKKEWKTLIESSAGSMHSTLSPVKDELAIDGVYVVPLETGVLRKPFSGGSPAWSYDGSKIAYLTNVFSVDAKITGIVEYDFLKSKSQLLYEPIVLGENYWPRVNMRIYDASGGDKPCLSWSPDGRYISFAAVYRHDNDSQIFRLDTYTGEVVALTTKFEETEGQYYYYSPVWGP